MKGIENGKYFCIRLGKYLTKEEYLSENKFLTSRQSGLKKVNEGKIK